MSEFFESESFVLPSQLKKDVASRLKQVKGIKSLELRMKGEALGEGKEFGQLLIELSQRGVKVSHEFTIKLDFPKSITREKALALVEKLPKPYNGSVKVRIQLSEDTDKA